ncbi:MAG: Aldo-keto reductase IolS [Gammaproteobacteria bacterium]|nr:Aldo-keto reductase IolS [Gammaproteobacteria bacterium]
MERVRFGATGLKVHPLCFGTMTLGGDATEKTSLELLDSVVDHGLNFVDSANLYNDGTAETIIGKWLASRGHRDRIILSSKVRYKVGDDPDTEGLSPRTIERELHRSLQRLNTDYLDIYFLHQPDYNTPLEITWQCLDRLARAGKFRYVGLSNFAAWQIADACHLARRNGWIQPTVVQCMYNLIARYPEHELFPVCRAFDCGVCNYNPLAGGLLTGKYGVEGEAVDGRLAKNEMYRARYWDPRQRQAAVELAAIATENDRGAVELAVQFCLDQPAVSTVILGATRVEQLRQSLEAVDGRPLSDEETDRCEAVWRQLSGPIPLYMR